MSKFLEFRQLERPEGRKTYVWDVVSIKGGEVLGRVSFWGPWRKFGFHPRENTLYDALCLRDIADFCHEQTNAWRGEVLARKT